MHDDDTGMTTTGIPTSPPTRCWIRPATSHRSAVSTPRGGTWLRASRSSSGSSGRRGGAADGQGDFGRASDRGRPGACPMAGPPGQTAAEPRDPRKSRLTEVGPPGIEGRAGGPRPRKGNHEHAGALTGAVAGGPGRQDVRVSPPGRRAQGARQEGVAALGAGDL